MERKTLNKETRLLTLSTDLEDTMIDLWSTFNPQNLSWKNHGMILRDIVVPHASCDIFENYLIFGTLSEDVYLIELGHENLTETVYRLDGKKDGTYMLRFVIHPRRKRIKGFLHKDETNGIIEYWQISFPSSGHFLGFTFPAKDILDVQAFDESKIIMVTGETLYSYRIEDNTLKLNNSVKLKKYSNYSLQKSSDGSKIFVIGKDPLVQIYDSDTLNLISSFGMIPKIGSVSVGELSGNRYVVFYYNTLQIYKSSGKLESTTKFPNPEDRWIAIFNHDIFAITDTFSVKMKKDLQKRSSISLEMIENFEPFFIAAISPSKKENVDISEILGKYLNISQNLLGVISNFI